MLRFGRLRVTVSSLSNQPTNMPLLITRDFSIQRWLLYAFRRRTSPPLQNLAVPQCQDPQDSQPRNEPQRHPAGRLRHSLRHRCLRKMHSCRRELGSYRRRDLLGRVCFSRYQLHILEYMLRGLYDPGVDPDPDGPKSGQKEHHPSPVDCLVCDCILERRCRGTGTG
jgi:hypothetical protein